MATPTELSVLLRLYTNKQNSPTVIIPDFCDYLQKYARHYLQEAPELSVYLEDTQTTVIRELERLEADSRIQLVTDHKGRRTAFVPQFFVDRIIQRFRGIDEHADVPFPLASDLPAGFPSNFLKPIYITTDFTALLEGTDRQGGILHQLNFPDDTPPLLYPSHISPEKLLDYALSKIRLFLRKDESRDFIQKRMMVANPGKELTIKNQLIQFQTRPNESMRAMKHAGEAYLFWNYLCAFIRQDFAKKVEKTPEETALIQSVYIAEYMNGHYKSKAQADLQRETALKNLELAFQKPPYYYDMETITRFTDSRGIPLLGQYKNTDLESFINDKTAETGLNSLPPLLVFKTENGNRYFVLKEKVIPLIVKLCNDGRTVIKDAVTREWYQLLREYRQEEAMHSQMEFERKVTSMSKTLTPVLFGILGATFIPLLALEGDGSAERDSGFRIFDHGRLLSHAALLMLNRQQLLTDTKIMLPFWYTIPILSAIIALFRRPRSKKPRPVARKTAAKTVYEDSAPSGGQDSRAIKQQRKDELKKAALAIQKRLVPADSTLEKEISARLDLWNRTLDSQQKDNLTEDVNSLIRDYIRRIVKTIRAANFDMARVDNLATTLVDTPGLMKIKNRDALLDYVKLYIVSLLKNIT